MSMNPRNINHLRQNHNAEPSEEEASLHDAAKYDARFRIPVLSHSQLEVL